MKVTPMQLWTYLDGQEETYADFLDRRGGRANGVTAEVFEELKRLNEDTTNQPIRLVIADQHMSENHPGGDDMVAAVDDVLAAIKDGYRIVTWYGPETEVLIAGYRPEHLTIEG